LPFFVHCMIRLDLECWRFLSSAWRPERDTFFLRLLARKDTPTPSSDACGPFPFSPFFLQTMVLLFFSTRRFFPASSPCRRPRFGRARLSPLVTSPRLSTPFSSAPRRKSGSLLCALSRAEGLSKPALLGREQYRLRFFPPVSHYEGSRPSHRSCEQPTIRSWTSSIRFRACSHCRPFSIATLPPPARVMKNDKPKLFFERG